MEITIFKIPKCRLEVLNNHLYQTLYQSGILLESNQNRLLQLNSFVKVLTLIISTIPNHLYVFIWFSFAEFISN